MIFHEVIQGEGDWFKSRLGIPTASEFGKIITPKTLQFSKQSHDYALQKIAEIMTQQTQGVTHPTYHMERGKIMEVEAGDAYEFIKNVRLDRGGFVTDDNGWFGASTDRRIIEQNAIMEIKCLDAKNHIAMLLKPEIDPGYIPQIQGQLMLYEADYCVHWIYHDLLPPVEIIIEKDPKFQEALLEALHRFRSMMNEMIEKLISDGHLKIPEPEKPKIELTEYLTAG